MSNDRPPIPDPVKRQVRQRCGFGCVICGRPLYHYEHMREYSATKRHVVEEITLLCAGHHDEKTRKWLSVEDVIAADKHPYNIRTGASSPYLWRFRKTELQLAIGSNLFTAPLDEKRHYVAAMVDGMRLLSFRYQDGVPLVSLRLYDQNNRLLMHVKDNELVIDSSAWDVEVSGPSITVREGLGRILLELRFDPSAGSIHVLRGHLYFNKHGFNIGVGDNGAVATTSGQWSWVRSHHVLSAVAMSVGWVPPGVGVILSDPSEN